LVKIWLKFGQNWVKIWSKFGQNLVKVWSKFGQNLVKIWSKFGQNLVKIWRLFKNSRVMLTFIVVFSFKNPNTFGNLWANLKKTITLTPMANIGGRCCKIIVGTALKSIIKTLVFPIHKG
jgi:hypothetical protein